MGEDEAYWFGYENGKAEARLEISNLKPELAALKARETRRKQLRKLVIKKPRTER